MKEICRLLEELSIAINVANGVGCAMCTVKVFSDMSGRVENNSKTLGSFGSGFPMTDMLHKLIKEYRMKHSINITVTLNGKEISPSEVSKQTWENLINK